jgi:hypothetical protein
MASAKTRTLRIKNMSRTRGFKKNGGQEQRTRAGRKNKKGRTIAK